MPDDTITPIPMRSPGDRAKRACAIYGAIGALSTGRSIVSSRVTPRSSYADAGITFGRDGPLTTVTYDGQNIACMVGRFSRETLVATLAANLASHCIQTCESMAAVLLAELELPERHWLQFDYESEARWVGANLSRHVSAHVRQTDFAGGVQSRVNAEFRIFLDEPRAILFVERGQPYVGQAVDLLTDAVRFPTATTYEELAARIAETFNASVALTDAEGLAEGERVEDAGERPGLSA
jgi:hypothetical protein